MSFETIDLRKAYGSNQVLKGIDLQIADGEVHALLGANGAGKSTFIKCVAGAVAPDQGQIHFGRDRYTSLTPQTARKAGVAVIYQDLSLASSLTVADNVFLGQELRRGPFVMRAQQEKETALWLERLGVDLSPGMTLTGVGHAELQTIEIIKALRARPQLLILDEPTAALSEREAVRLRQHLLALKREKLPILYVTHRMNEVFELADRFTVLRGGEVVLAGNVADYSREAIVEAIVGRSMETAAHPAPSARQARPCLLEAKKIWAAGIGPLDLKLHGGEILGIFGLVGAGRTELLEALFGARPRYGGSIEIGGRRLPMRSPSESVIAGVALVPADRPRNSVFADLSARENWGLPNLAHLSWAGLRRPYREAKGFDRMARKLDLRPNRGDLQARQFSGGNQQKLVIGRWLERQNCRVLLLDEPTQGVDVGARRDLYDALRHFVADADRGAIVTSSEPEELIQLAQRVIVLANGGVAGVLSGLDITEANLLALAHHQLSHAASSA